jgi:hypothetical protein
VSNKDTEPEPIEPVLTAEEWSQGLRWRDQSVPAKAVAIANSKLPDDDPRKITHEVLDLILQADVMESINGDASPVRDATDRVHAFATALRSYLPPETP